MFVEKSIGLVERFLRQPNAAGNFAFFQLGDEIENFCPGYYGRS